MKFTPKGNIYSDGEPTKLWCFFDFSGKAKRCLLRVNNCQTNCPADCQKNEQGRCGAVCSVQCGFVGGDEGGGDE